MKNLIQYFAYLKCVDALLDSEKASMLISLSNPGQWCAANSSFIDSQTPPRHPHHQDTLNFWVGVSQWNPENLKPGFHMPDHQEFYCFLTLPDFAD